MPGRPTNLNHEGMQCVRIKSVASAWEINQNPTIAEESVHAVEDSSYSHLDQRCTQDLTMGLTAQTGNSYVMAQVTAS
jgi:hypothetical protein